MKTIRQIADEIGVSKQAVFKKIKHEPLSTSLQGLTATVDGRLMVEVDGEKLIKQAFSEIIPSTKNEEKTAEVDGVVSVLQATIDTLQGQLEVKDRQLEQQVQTIPGSLTRWPQRSRQRQRPRLFTQEHSNSSF